MKLLQDYSTKSVCVCDLGYFMETANVLARSFGKVYYFSPWVTTSPTTNAQRVGAGFPGVTRVEDIWSILDKVDLFVFPDIYEGPLQIHLAEDCGKRVWGSRRGDEFETLREDSKRFFEKIDLPVGKWKAIRGLSNLREYLKNRDNQFVKISTTRGDFETFPAKNYRYIESRLDALEHRLGRFKEEIDFICEERIPDAVEVAYDGYTVDGQFPGASVVGIEVKEKGYVGHFLRGDKVPEQLRDINETLSSRLKRYKYRNFFAIEVRVTPDGTPWIIDPCCRQGSPPSEALIEVYGNLPDIFWYGAEGECIDPEPVAEWCAEVVLHSGWAERDWLEVQFPEEIRQWVKLRNCARLKGKLCILPEVIPSSHIGAVVALGKTMQEAIDTCMERVTLVEGYYIDPEPDALDDAAEKIEELADYGVRI